MTCNSQPAIRRQHLAYVLAPVMLLIFVTQIAYSQDEASTQTDTPQQSDRTASDLAKKAATDRPVPSNTSALEGDFRLFDGEWKMHAASFGTTGQTTRTSGLPELGWIRNGIISFGKNQLEYRVIESDQTHGVIQIVGPDSQESMCEVERLTQILFLRITAPERVAPKPTTPSDLNLASKATEHSRQDVVFEFWKIDSQRQNVMKQLESLLHESNTLRQTGTPDEFRAANQRVLQVTAQLQKLDDAPRIQSLTYEVIAARKAGKHEEANRLELQIPGLPADTDSLLATQSKFDDSEAQQDIGIRITDTQVILDKLKRSLGAAHPKVHEAQQRLTLLQSLQSKDKNSGNNSQEQITASRTQLEKERQSLVAEYDSAQQVTLRLASDLRSKAVQESVPPDVLLSLQKQLRKSVTAAFDVQQKLQTVRLSIAQRDLQDLRLKHKHRRTLAEQVIERRVRQLLQDDELLWSKAKGVNKTTDPNQPKQITQNSFVKKTTPTDPELLGEWTLVQASPSDGMALQPNSRLTVSDNRLQLSRYGQQLHMDLKTNTQVTPYQVSIVDVSNVLIQFTGIYQIADDVLKIVWTPNDQGAARPTTLLFENGKTQIWKRVKPLPTFETPQQLLSFFDSITQSESPDFDKLVRLLTDDEADRFAGFLIASTGMMQRMMPLIMMAEQMGDTDDDGPDLATFTAVSTFLNKAIAPHAAPECVQAFRDLTNTDASFMTGQLRVPMTDIDAFSEKLRLAGRAVGDSRLFAVQILNLLDGMSNDSGKDKKNKPKPDWLVTQEGDSAIAVNQATVKTKDDLGGGKLRLQRIGNSWSITSMIADDNLAEIAAMTTGPIMGTDEAGNKVPISSIFGMPEEPPTAKVSTPTIRSVKVPQAMNALAAYTKIDKLDIATVEVMTDELSPISESEVVGKFLNRRLKRFERITRDMLVEDPTTEQIVKAYLQLALDGEEVFQRRGYPARTYPQSSQSVLDLPYDIDPKRFHSELPDWIQAFVDTVVDRLKQTPTMSWSDEEFHLLWSLEPLVANATDDSPYDLQQLAQLMEAGLASGISDEDLKPDRSFSWSSGLTFGIVARLNGNRTELLFEQPVLEDSKKTALLRTMCANKAEWKWIDQEHVRLAGLMQDSPIQTIAILIQGNWPGNNSVATNWLYALSTPEQYDASRSSPREDCPPPVDPLLLVLTMNHLAGESAETDEHIAAFFEEPHPSYAFLRHLDDLLSSKLTYRDTALDALAQMYQKTSSQKLKAAIKKVAPGASVPRI